MRAAVYLRISQDRTGDELGVTRQRDDAQQLVSQRGWTLIHEYPDNDVSAAGKKPRPQFDAMLASVERGEIDAIVAWSLDRLTRNRRDQLRLIETCEPHRVTIALCRGSDMDLSTPAGRMSADILASVARNEIEVKSDRSR
ncbi:MAG: recombinase family protein, partial [Streptosporangiales bacterium]